MSRIRAKAIVKLKEYARWLSCIEDMAVIYATTEDEAKKLVCDLQQYIADKKIMVTLLGAVPGALTGAEALLVAAVTKS